MSAARPRRQRPRGGGAPGPGRPPGSSGRAWPSPACWLRSRPPRSTPTRARAPGSSAYPLPPSRLWWPLDRGARRKFRSSAGAEDRADVGVGHDDVGALLERVAVLVVEGVPGVGLEQRVGFLKEAPGVLLGQRLLGVDQLVDARDHLGQGAQPRERRVVQQQVEQVSGRHGAVPRFVDEALAVQQQAVQPRQALAQCTQGPALVHAFLLHPLVRRANGMTPCQERGVKPARMMDGSTVHYVGGAETRCGVCLALRGLRMRAPRLWLLIMVSILVIAGLLAADHLARMNRRFFVASIPGAQAFAHYLRGDYPSAARLYRVDLSRRAARLEPAQVWSWTMMMTGDLDGAAAEAGAEAGREPENPEPLLTLAEIALAQGELPRAIEFADRVLRLRRDDYDALLVIAVAQGRQGRPEDAIDALKRALRYERTERRFTVSLPVMEVTAELASRAQAARPACLLAHLHRYLRIYDPAHAATAAAYAEQAIAGGDRPDDAYVTLAVIQTKRGYRRAALEAFQHALEVNPRNTAALLGAARRRADRGEVAEEYRLTKAAFHATPGDAFVAASLHELLMRKIGDYRQARSMAETAASANANDAEAWWRLAHVMSHLGDHRGALEA